MLISLMMRFKQGDKVEVMNKKEVPFSWLIAEILSGNGHSFCVRYDSFPGMSSELMVETVSRKFVRPFPPLVQGIENCVTGDIVEVFYELSWKIAAIVKTVDCKKENISNKIHLQAAGFQNQYLVRLIGCSKELIIEGSNIRLRQAWHDEKWILMGKNSQRCEDTRAIKPSTSICCQNMNFQMPLSNAIAKNPPQKDWVISNVAFWESPVISSRSLKRMSPYDSSTMETHNGHVHKLRAVEQDGRKQRVVAACVHKKVDAVAYPREILGEKNMHASVKIISNRYNQTKSAKQNDVLGCSGVRISEYGFDSDACSVGSCSVTNQSPNNICSYFVPLPYQVTDASCSDAESCYGSDSERKSCYLPPKEEVEVSIHRLELHAYRSTLEALYASGPLSWEQESLLTNLRIMLHISNDEHLMELKHLISAKTAVNVR